MKERIISADKPLMQVFYTYNYPDGPTSRMFTLRVSADSILSAIEKSIPMIQQEIIELIEDADREFGKGELDPPKTFTIVLVRDWTTGEYTTIDKEVTL